MNGFLSINDKLISVIQLPEALLPPGEYHLSEHSLAGMKAEPVVDLHSGAVIGYEILSVLPRGGNSEVFFSEQSASSLAELFLLQLHLSHGLVSGRRLLNLPVRVLTRPELCQFLCTRNLNGITVEIQDPENLPTLSPAQLDLLGQNLLLFRHAGAEIFADDVSPDLLLRITQLSWPLSGIKISREQFQSLDSNADFCATNMDTPSGGEFFLVAEGIETHEQYLLAALLGFTHGQGWLWPANCWLFIPVRSRDMVNAF
ncbi:EAL domain-containing protein [Salmonella enterica]|nr:EAL domain-containing protein [Salmonella enterica]EMA2939222.1 EAL domain-containing protein [Salmonella enterica]HCX7090128.1 EAL domain-containing protein [Salmonella enterica subsp. enterica]